MNAKTRPLTPDELVAIARSAQTHIYNLAHEINGGHVAGLFVLIATSPACSAPLVIALGGSQDATREALEHAANVSSRGPLLRIPLITPDNSN